MSTPPNADGTSVPRDQAIHSADEQQLVERVRKLMAKSESSANPHESDSFARKAAELVIRHRIDPARLDDQRSTEQLVVREFPLGRGAYVRGRLALLTAIAEAHDARVVFGSRPTGTTAYAAGFANDLDVVEVMYESLHAQMAARMAGERRSTAAATQRFRRSFMFGFAERVGALLSETRQAAEDEVAAGRSSGNLPALRQRAARVEEFLDQSFGRIRTARSAAGAEATGWSAGSVAADGVDVGRPRLPERRALGRG